MALTLLRFNSPQLALAALQDKGVRFLGGGSLLVRMTNTGRAEISTFVRLDAPAQRNLEIVDLNVYVGASVRMSEIVRNSALSWLSPVAASIGGPAIQNMATVGGNLHAPLPYGDLATALVALEAVVHVYGDKGSENLPIAEFLARREASAGNAIVQGVTFTTPASGTFLFKKIRRTHPHGSALLSIAAVVEQSDGNITKARIALGSMAPTAIRALAVERALVGRPLSLAGIAPALALALEGTSPIDNSIASAWYRRTVLPVHLRRLLLAEGNAS
jgi:CO/xanthine dehydrogenase FAD-binding subunit